MNPRISALALLVVLLATYQLVMTQPAVAGPRVHEEKALTFMQMVEEAMAQVQGVSATDALYRLNQDSNILLVDVSDTDDVLNTGLVVGGVNITLGMLPVHADLELPTEFHYAGLQDRTRPIITTCQGGPNGARAAKLLNDMGFTDVVYIEGGMQAWTSAGLPTNLSTMAQFQHEEEMYRPGEY